jgi:predicted CXXCH cytochrome family protein
MKQQRMLLLLAIFLIPLVLIFSQCFNADQKTDARGKMYAGSASCVKCHKDIYSSYLHTAHFKTSQLASPKNINGSFAEGSNVFEFNKETKVVMEKRKDGFYQVGYRNNKPFEAHRFDITFGTVKGETYLYWKGNQVYQLPMSYFNALHSWTNSPGYDSTNIDFGRVIGRRCFECHSSYIGQLPQQNQSLQRVEKLDKNTMILSIDCERCHGPSANHVNYHTDYPEEKVAHFIRTYKSLSRQQKLDMCAVCHSGNKSTMLASTFGFKPGDTLAKYKEAEFYHENTNPANLDVHGNQMQLLASSPCFIKSKLDCTTCHNTHTSERGNLILYSQRCINCHKNSIHSFTKNAPGLNAMIKQNCIDCHMPAKPSNVISVKTSGKGMAIPYLVRTHHITIYPPESEKILAYLKSGHQQSK